MLSACSDNRAEDNKKIMITPCKWFMIRVTPTSKTTYNITGGGAGTATFCDFKQDLTEQLRAKLQRFLCVATSKMTERRYGYFRCTKCNKLWESSLVYCRAGTDDPVYQQDCKACNTACFPCRVEKIVCSKCGRTECICTKEDLEDKKRHTDPNKPHRSDLCHRCRAGLKCTKRDYWNVNFNCCIDTIRPQSLLRIYRR